MLRPIASILLLLLADCSHTDILVPAGAPMMLSQSETIHDPYLWVNGQWTMKQGTATATAGETVILLPATRPAETIKAK